MVLELLEEAVEELNAVHFIEFGAWRMIEDSEDCSDL